eukprot:TRINITY_DN557_c0_g3_i3.p1 TRINITY_DN557_c0_g3~~TRINITY_DN557_c0_g3_i3.p1  ORF type:complete len:421 (+),score=75.45 TRINITY_DN557_c0_g3_i3:62-1324(+)
MQPDKTLISMTATQSRYSLHSDHPTQLPHTSAAQPNFHHLQTHSHSHSHGHSLIHSHHHHGSAPSLYAGPSNAAVLPLTLSSNSLGSSKTVSPMIERAKVLNAIDTDFDRDEFPDSDEEPQQAPQTESKKNIRKQLFGVSLVVFVVTIWVLTAELMQYIFEEQEYSKPFFLTFFSNGLLMLFLLRHMTSWKSTREIFQALRSASVLRDYRLLPEDDKSIPSSPEQERSEAVDGDGEYPPHIIASIAIKISPFWFLSIWSYNASLVLTSVASNTILSSTSSLFVLVIGRIVGMETITIPKAISAVVTVAGVALVALGDGGGFEGESFIGDLVSLASAIFYAIYTLLLKGMLKDEKKASMTLFFGFLGLVCTLLMWPFFLILHFTGLETFEFPEGEVLGFLFLNGLVGTLLSVSHPLITILA